MEYEFAQTNIDFNQFADELELELREQFSESLPDYVMKRSWIEKLQGESYLSLTVGLRDGITGVNINLSRLYEEAVSSCRGQEKGSIPEIAKRTAASTVERLHCIGDFDISILDSYEKARPHLITQLISISGNEQMLKNIPFMQIEDLAVIYRISVSLGSGSETTIVTNDLLDSFRVTVKQLHEDALKNDAVLRPAVVREMLDVLTEISGQYQPEVSDFCGPKLFFIGNSDHCYGASAIFYPGVLEKCYKILKNNYYILPSSIHEMLIVADEPSIRRENINEMIREINRELVHPAERLADHGFYYDGREKRFRAI